MRAIKVKLRRENIVTAKLWEAEKYIIRFIACPG